MQEKDNFNVGGWHINPQNVPIDGIHHHPLAQGFSHLLRNSFIHVHLFHGPGGLPDIPKLLKWFSFLGVKTCILLFFLPIPFMLLLHLFILVNLTARVD